VDEPQRHAASLLVLLDELLASCNERLDDYELIALSVGPGSFTGLRVGLALALGLCFDTERRIVPVSTLAALALSAGSEARSVPLLDARRGQVYAGLYGPGAEPLREDCICDLEPWLASLRGDPGPLAFLGSGAERHADVIRAALAPRARLLSAASSSPRASNVGRLGARLASVSAALPPERVELRYLRPAEAERRRRSGHLPAERIS
jgi:tRNA threonylcarbamoyladenosine biosynthesis protein TsaB